MARLVGIEISATHVRAVGVSTSYRRASIDRVAEVERQSVPELEEALKLCVLPMIGHGESVAVAVEGTGTFIHHIELPATAVRQLAQVVPIELEARLPIDIELLVYDHILLREPGTSDTVRVIAAAARTADIEPLLSACRASLGREVERVGCGPLPLANLVGLFPTVLRTPQPIAIVDLSYARVDVLVLVGGEPAYARTTSTGVEKLPDSAPALVAELRQTLMAWQTQGGEPVTALYLSGFGASVAGAEAYLAHELGVSVLPLPLAGMAQLPESEVARLPRYAKALGAALGLGSRARDPDLRQGVLGFQRGYAFLRDKAPLLCGLLASVAISYGFSAWAESRALARQQETLVANLAAISKSVLGESMSDPEAATELLQTKRALDDADPMPYMDAFDVLIELSNAVPTNIVHDIEEFDMQREHVKLTGIVGTAAEAQQVSSNLQQHRCFQDVRLGKVTQVINSDRQKYGLEWDVRCPEDQSSRAKPKKKTDDAAGGGAR